MRILKEGKLRSERWFKGSCHSCGCEVQFQQHEGKYTDDQRDGEFCTITCPTKGCGQPIHGYPKKVSA